MGAAWRGNTWGPARPVPHGDLSIGRACFYGDLQSDLARLVPACAEAGGYNKIVLVEILGGEGEIFIKVAAFERVGVAARTRVCGGLR